MNVPRAAHGLQKMNGKIYVFGGGRGTWLLESAEVYNVLLKIYA